MSSSKAYVVPGYIKGKRREDDYSETSAARLNEAGPSNSRSSDQFASLPTTSNLDSGIATPGSPYKASEAKTSEAQTPPLSLSGFGNYETDDATNFAYSRADVTCSYVYQQQLISQYASGLMPGEGVVIKVTKKIYTSYPPELQDIPYGLFNMAMEMNVPSAMTINTRVVAVLLSSELATRDYIPFLNGLRLQILPSMRDLPRCQKHHFAAFIRDLKILVIWDNDPRNLLDRAEALEQGLIKTFWGSWIEDDGQGGVREKMPTTKVRIAPIDLEKAIEKKRKIKLTSALIVAMTVALCVSCMGLGLRALAFEVQTDGSYVRLALIAVIPIEIWVAFFFFQSLITNLFQIVGPISAVDKNSRYFSGKPPRRLHSDFHTMPHVTIQMPVYKEGLEAVIKPSVDSLKQCISTYEMQGGSANIFINDDGMQLISDQDASIRREFYSENNIGWVARPKHNPTPDDGSQPFLRRGKFKKASNMNYALMVSNRVEDKLHQIPRSSDWTQVDEQAVYNHCLAEVLQEDEGRTWAEGDVRIGDYILIVDSDTRVPEDCLLDAVSEMEQAPQIAILQFASGVMQVSTSFFEGGVKWFTNLIYTAITFVVANGDACPFVGHNAVLRWSAIQDAAAYEEDGYEKYWSEAHVSEDFEMSLKLQCAGYELRFASYTGTGFQEGVSLTVYDELARWEKYAYGCNELMFHPLKYWLSRGPITPLFRKFIFSGIHLPKKLTICAYIGTYYAIGACWILTLMNYLLSGWFFGLYDKFYIDSFAIYVSVIVVFTGLGNCSLSIMRYRLTQMSFIPAFWDNIKWIPLMTVFLGGLSLHVSQALLCHFFGIDMAWGATAKEVEEVNFVKEIPRLLWRFKGTFIWCILMTALIICGFFAFPDQWRIVHLASIWPLAWTVGCHFMLPVVLNPALMMFSW
ncbi:glycosyl transferase family group 2-domain-containing protein [Daldinia sp. FL1419]|nr:glycosyl transferase family group 2-domain-containing protein [Daldinia sp. FL1419]